MDNAEAIFREYVAADQRLKQETQEWAERRGVLRSNLSNMRAALLTCLPEGSQLAIQIQGQSQPSYLRRVSQTSRKQISHQMLQEAAEAVFKQGTFGEHSSPDTWRDDLRKALVSEIKGRIVTRKPYVDVVSQPAAGADGKVTVSEQDPRLAEMAAQLATMKGRLRELQTAQAAALRSPKRRLGVLKEKAKKVLPSMGSRVRVSTGSGDVFVGTKLKQTRATRRLTLQELDSLIDSTLTVKITGDKCPVSAREVTAALQQMYDSWRQIAKDRSAEVSIYKARTQRPRGGKAGGR